ncbi:hypothetical protein TRIHO_19480 [Tritonibacter horizontis]|uniref:NAD-specific glutamate dehydrogenase n=1 Tax=Tritonibacter horizontis TaxID=1768241 RepID=A0A132BXS6_9RHOB|nr:hypothetical protein TRIHO_19480 [Tritonibacter horizontis]
MRQGAGFVTQTLGCGRGFFEHGGILLRHLIQLIGGGGDFLQARGLFACGIGQGADGFIDRGNMLVDLIQCRAGIPCQGNPGLDLAAGVGNQLGNLARRVRGFAGQCPHLACDHRKPAPGLARAGGLNPGIQRQKAGLERDIIDERRDAGDFLRAFLDALHGVDGLFHHLRAALCAFAGLFHPVRGSAAFFGGVAHRGRQFGQRGRGLLERGRLGFGPHAQLAGGRIQRLAFGFDLDHPGNHRAHQVGNLRHRGVKVLCNLAELVRHGVLDADGQVAAGKFRQSLAQNCNNALAFLVLGAGFDFHRRLHLQPVAKIGNSLCHLADLAAVLQARHVAFQVTIGHGPHAVLQGVERRQGAANDDIGHADQQRQHNTKPAERLHAHQRNIGFDVIHIGAGADIPVPGLIVLDEGQFRFDGLGGWVFKENGGFGAPVFVQRIQDHFHDQVAVDVLEVALALGADPLRAERMHRIDDFAVKGIDIAVVAIAQVVEDLRRGGLGLVQRHLTGLHAGLIGLDVAAADIGDMLQLAHPQGIGPVGGAVEDEKRQAGGGDQSKRDQRINSGRNTIECGGHEQRPYVFGFPSSLRQIR